MSEVRCVDGTNPAGISIRAIVISHSCEIDKSSVKHAYVAAVLQIPLSQRPQIPKIKDGEFLNLFYLPETPALGSESYVDLRTIFRVPFEELGCSFEKKDLGNRWLAHPDRRVAALSEVGISLLQFTCARYFGYGRDLALRDAIRVA